MCGKFSFKMSWSLCVVVVLATANVWVEAGTQSQVSVGSIWPQPQSFTQGNGVIYIDPTSFKISSSTENPVLLRAFARFRDHLFFPFQGGPIPGGLPTLSSVSITVQNDTSERFYLLDDESYTIQITSTQNNPVASIACPQTWGCIRALESFSQLIIFNLDNSTYQMGGIPTNVTDYPRFAWRGLLIDTARHYLHPAAIKRTIDAMSYSKFNTLHWHAVDAESYPMVMDNYPLLSEMGSWGPRAIYNHTVIKDIVTYANERGIRVVPEFDMPGHAYSWGLGYSNLTTTCPNYAANIDNIPFNPTINFTYEVINDVLSEMTPLFWDNYWHQGGDEVVYGCWLENPNVTSWMLQHHIKSGPELEQYFELKLQTIIKAHDRQVVAWEDVFDNGIRLNMSTTIFEVWDDPQSLNAIVTAGYRAITSYGYYLNDQVPIPGGEVGEWVDTWKDFYATDPMTGVNGSLAFLVLGGEAAMWGEQVDSVNIDSRVWPRACAVAERLWSAEDVTNLNTATNRLAFQRCHIARRGIGAGPIIPDYCPTPGYEYPAFVPSTTE